MTTICRRSLALAGALPLVALAASCGGDQTTASKSAAAFDAAQQKGVTPAAGEAHGGHGQAADPESSRTAGDSKNASSMTGMDHSHMPGMGTPPGAHPAAGAGSSMAGMDHSRMPGMGTASGPPPKARAGSSMAGMDHSRMSGMGTASGPRPKAAAGSSIAGVDHSTMPGMGNASGAHPAAGAASSMPGMEHPTMPGMDHTNMNMAPSPEPATAAARPGQTAATLQPNELDRPPTTSLREAARAAAMAEEMAAGGHGMVHGTYRQIDAGSDDVTPPPEGRHEGHPAAPPSQAPPSAGSQHMHSAPTSPRPESSPRADEKDVGSSPPGGHEHGQTRPRGQPSHSPDPHRMHSMPPSPQPTPSPRPEARPQ
jgi:hypothetical protein